MKNTTRNPLRKLATRMMTPSEVRSGIPPFSSKAWTDRKDARAKRELSKFKGIGRMNATQRTKILKGRKQERLKK